MIRARVEIYDRDRRFGVAQHLGGVTAFRLKHGGPVAVENEKLTVKQGAFVRIPHRGDNILLWLPEEEEDTIYATCWTYMEDWESAREYLADHDERPERAEDKPHGKY